jgi:hypothetical protein
VDHINLHSLNDSLAVVGLVRDDYGGRAVEATKEGEHQSAVVLVGAVAFPVKLGVAVIALHV